MSAEQAELAILRESYATLEQATLEAVAAFAISESARLSEPVLRAFADRVMDRGWLRKECLRGEP